MLFGIPTGTYVKLGVFKTETFKKNYGNGKKYKNNGEEKF